MISPPATFDFLFGAATAVAPRQVVDEASCVRCHGEVLAHGNGRRGLATCLLCHASPGVEDAPLYNFNGWYIGQTPAVTTDFRTMLHKIHMARNWPTLPATCERHLPGRALPGRLCRAASRGCPAAPPTARCATGPAARPGRSRRIATTDGRGSAGADLGRGLRLLPRLERGPGPHRRQHVAGRPGELPRLPRRRQGTVRRIGAPGPLAGSP